MARGQENPKRIDRTNVAARCRVGAKPTPCKGKTLGHERPSWLLRTMARTSREDSREAPVLPWAARNRVRIPASGLYLLATSLAPSAILRSDSGIREEDERHPRRLRAPLQPSAAITHRQHHNCDN